MTKDEKDGTSKNMYFLLVKQSVGNCASPPRKRKTLEKIEITLASTLCVNKNSVYDTIG